MKGHLLSQGRQHTSGTDDALSIASKQTPQRSRSIESEERETVTKPPVKKSIFARVPRLPPRLSRYRSLPTWTNWPFVGSYLGTSLQAETSRAIFRWHHGGSISSWSHLCKAAFAPHSKRTAHWMALSFLLVSTTCVVIGAIHPDMTKCPHVACRYLRRNRRGSNRHSLVRALWLPRPSARRAVLLGINCRSSTHRLHHEGLSLPVVCYLPVHAAHRVPGLALTSVRFAV